MDTPKVISITAIVVALVALGVTYFGPARTDTIREVIRERLGAVSGPDMLFDYINLNGVTLHPRRLDSFVSATTTPITVRAPVNATSTLMLGSGCHFTLASTSAKAAHFGKSANPNSTSTFLFGSTNIPASAASSSAATTTNAGFLFEPGYYLNVSLVGGSGTDSPTGHCNFLFMEL